MFFSFSDTGHTFHLYSLQHLLATLFFAILPCLLIIFYKKKLAAWKYEKNLRISIGIFGLFLDFFQYSWYLFSGGSNDWREIIPTTLCGLSIYLSSIAMITLNRRISSWVYYLSFGAFFSFLFADVSHGYDRFRFYGFFVIHGLILLNTVYLRAIHRVKADRKALKDTSLLLLPILILSFFLNHVFDMNFFYMSFPLFPDFPIYQGLYDFHPYAFSAAVFISYYMLLLVMAGLAKLMKTDR
jgi:hypothetical integral membrane protein (TIGR02206 family)